MGVGVEVVEEAVELGEGEWFSREAKGFLQVEVIEFYVVDVGVGTLDPCDAGFLAPCEGSVCLLVEAFEGYPVGGQADPLLCGRENEPVRERMHYEPDCPYDGKQSDGNEGQWRTDCERNDDRGDADNAQQKCSDQGRVQLGCGARENDRSAVTVENRFPVRLDE